ncbi:MAG TPA: hypothetical protein VGJ21_09895 [Terracidiphilus sp.]|jgi:hypothetical protein
MLQSMHRDNKGDADIAAALKQAELSEQLTRPVMNNLADFTLGQSPGRGDRIEFHGENAPL